MGRRHLLVGCGVPGAGKSTFGAYTVSRWGVVAFDSDTFLERLRGAGDTSDGDFTERALTEAYSAMATAVAAALPESWFVVVVGSFRVESQRARFREIALDAGATTTTLRIDSPSELAAERVRLRIAEGGRGPTLDAIERIGANLDTATDLDLAVTNSSTIPRFYQRIDSIMESLVWVLDEGAYAPSAFVERFEELAAAELAITRATVEPERLRTWPPDRVSAVVRKSLPNDVQTSVVPTTPQHCRIDVRSAYLEAVGSALQEAGLRISQDRGGLSVFLPALSPTTRGEIIAAIELELQRARDRMREVRNCLLLGLPRPFDSTIEAALQKAADKWVNAVDQLGSVVLSDVSE